MAALRRYRTVSVELEPHFIEMMAGYDCDGKTITDFKIEPCVCKSDTLHKPHIISGGLCEIECSGNPRIYPVCRCGDRRPHKKHHVPGNKEVLEQALGRKVKWDILQGDARELEKLLHESGLVGVVSPPYTSQVAYQDKEFIISIAEDKSQRYRDGRLKGHYGSPEAIRRYGEKIMETYSPDPRNIGNLPDKPLAGIVSPPYQDTAMPMGCPSHIRKLAKEGNWDRAIELEREAEAEQARKGKKFAVSTDETIRKKIEMALDREKGNYSQNSDNIGNLPDVPLAGIVSPPYGAIDIGKGIRPNRWEKVKDLEGFKGRKEWESGTPSEYSKNPDNIGNLVDVPLVGIMSPPYSEAQQGGGIAIKGYSGPHIHEMGKNQPGKVGQTCGFMKEVHGNDPANIANLPDRPIVGITSPPYTLDPKNLCHTREGKTLEDYDKKRGFSVVQHPNVNYGTNPRNIGNLPDRPVVGITSPPYANRLDGGKELSGIRLYTKDAVDTWFTERDPTNIGNLTDGVQSRDGRESYLSAMFKVYQQAFLCGISPLCVVVKNPTRNGKLRRLDIDSIFLLQKSGYEIFDYHRAILFETHTQSTLDGESKDVHKGRISFFKRLSLGKGTTVAQWEDVIFCRIPECARAIQETCAHDLRD